MYCFTAVYFGKMIRFCKRHINYENFYNFLECAADWRNKFERDEKKNWRKKNSFKFKIVQSSVEEQQAARPIL